MAKHEIDDTVVWMFKMIDRIWHTIERDRRRSFLNYYYIIYKLLEFMDQTELMQKVPLLRTQLRLRQHDVIWKKVCDELEWTWRPTILSQSLDKPKHRTTKRKVANPTTPSEITNE